MLPPIPHTPLLQNRPVLRTRLPIQRILGLRLLSLRLLSLRLLSQRLLSQRIRSLRCTLRPDRLHRKIRSLEMRRYIRLRR